MTTLQLATPGYCVIVTWADGTHEFVKQGIDGTQRQVFASRLAAEELADMVRAGMDDGECQSVRVVDERLPLLPQFGEQTGDHAPPEELRERFEEQNRMAFEEAELALDTRARAWRRRWLW